MTFCLFLDEFVPAFNRAPVAQLDRALDSDSKGRWFDSSRAYQIALTWK